MLGMSFLVVSHVTILVVGFVKRCMKIYCLALPCFSTPHPVHLPDDVSAPYRDYVAGPEIQARIRDP